LLDSQSRFTVEYRDGFPLKEPVHVESLGDDRYRLLFSPGLVLGITAGDEFRLVGKDGAFEIIRRGGNLSVILQAEEPVDGLIDELRRRVKKLGGRIDGQVEQSLVCSIPLAAGFPAVDALFEEWGSQHTGWVSGTTAMSTTMKPAKSRSTGGSTNRTRRPCSLSHD
jgi:hypothetical protein